MTRTLAMGDRLAGYRIGSRLGRGGIGVVHLADQQFTREEDRAQGTGSRVDGGRTLPRAVHPRVEHRGIHRPSQRHPDLRGGRGRRPNAVAVGAGSIWVTDLPGGVVERFDPVTDRPVATISVGNSPRAIGATEEGVFVANATDGTVSRIDQASNTVVATIAVGGCPMGITARAGSMWVPRGPRI